MSLTTLKLPAKPKPKPEQQSEFLSNIKPMVGRRVVLTHRLGYTITGDLLWVGNDCLRLTNADVRSRDHTVDGLQCFVVRGALLSHVHEYVPASQVSPDHAV